MERGKDVRKRIVLIDPVTKKILYDPQRERDDLQRKIRDAALVDRKLVKGKRWNVSHGQGPEFNEDQEDQADIFFSEMVKLMWDHKSFMDKKGFEGEVQADIDEKLKLAEESIKQIICDLAISERTCKSLMDPLVQKLRKEMEKCLKKPPNRMDQTVNEIVCMNRRSDTWRKREDDLIKRIVVLYDKYTPLKKKSGKINVSQIVDNLNLISKACDIFGINSDALSKRIKRIVGDAF